MNNKKFPSSVPNLEPNPESCRLSEVSEEYESLGERVTTDHQLLIPSKEVSFMAVMVSV